MENTTILYKKTIVGWYNVTVAGVMRYNVNPITFRKVTSVSKDAKLGTCEINPAQLEAFKENAKYLGLANGWEWVASDNAAGY